MRAQDVWLRGPFLKKLPVSLLCSFLDYAPCSDHVPACRSFDLPVSPFVKDQWLALSCDKPPRRSLTTSSVKVCFLDLPSDEDASGVCTDLFPSLRAALTTRSALHCRCSRWLWTNSHHVPLLFWVLRIQYRRLLPVPRS